MLLQDNGVNSDGGNEGKEITSKIDISVRELRFACTSVYNSYTVHVCLGGKILGEFSAQYSVRIAGRRGLC